MTPEDLRMVAAASLAGSEAEDLSAVARVGFRLDAAIYVVGAEICERLDQVLEELRAAREPSKGQPRPPGWS